MNWRHGFKRVIKFGHLSPEEVSRNQKCIRDLEWLSVSNYIKPESKFLDVGCGTGYFLTLSKIEKNCEAIGVDPSPHGAGVKFWNGKDSKIHNSHIIQAGGESLPFPAEDFDVVFSSHVLEHVLDQVKVLQEMKRVLKKEGILIIGVPTHHMAWIQLISSVLFTTHLRLMKYFIGILDRSYSLRFVNVLIPPSHSYENKTVLYDLKYYRPKIWESLIKDEFKIKERIFPALYAYPDFIQLFKPRKLRGIGSSVYFICHK